MDARSRIATLAALVALAHSSACATLTDAKVPLEATRDDEIALAGKTLECAGVAHERVLWSSLGAAAAAVAAQGSLVLVTPLAMLAGPQNPQAAGAIVGVGVLGAIGLGVTSLGLSGYALFEQYRAARYEQQTGQLLTHSSDSSCFVAKDGPESPSPASSTTTSTETPSTSTATDPADPAERLDRLP